MLSLARLDDLGRLSRTVLHLRPAQVGQRLRLRAQRMALDHSVPLADRWLLGGPGPVFLGGPAAEAGWPRGFTPLDAELWSDGPTGPALRAGYLPLLGASRRIAPAVGQDTVGRETADWAEADWRAADEPLLWRFHLYYWDWAWALAGEPEARDTRALFAEIWESWHSAVAPGRGPAWLPYPTALRAWSFCGLYRPLVAGHRIEGPFVEDLARHARFLRRNLETDVGGNHLVKNLKALAGLGVFFADDGLLARVLGRLRRQLGVQVLPDGGHYERAPAYHCQVLGDLIDISRLLRAAGRAEPPELPEAIAAMRRWLGLVLTPAGDVPLLNDGFPVRRELLGRLAAEPPPAGPLHLLRDTGLARAAVGPWHLLADVGLPGPRELPAHAHADSLSCLVYVAGVPLLVDTGTSSYAAGPVRDRERSTAAHNTVEIDGGDSTEVWGAFRAGRRARPRGVSAWLDGDTAVIEAAHDGYRGQPGRPAHRRRWSLRPDELRVDDAVTGRGRHRVVLRWHLPPETELWLTRDGAEVATGAGWFSVSATAVASGSAAGAGLAGQAQLTAETAELGTGFEHTAKAPVLVCAVTSELPVRISTVWRQTYPRQERP